MALQKLLEAIFNKW